MLQACLNGVRDIRQHHRLTADPAALAQEAAKAVAAGAQTLHIHPKNPQGKDTLEPHYVASWLGAVRDACPGIPVGVTTGAWTTPDLATRLKRIESWHELPDFASVNWHEDGAEEVAGLLHARGVGIEAGVWHGNAARLWASSPLRNRCLRVLIELQEIPAEVVGIEAVRLLALVREHAPQARVLLHGEDTSAWAALKLAIEWGLDARVGLEDTLLLPNGRRTAGNADLVAAAKKLLAV
ncbi:3-keto-5-aminohexanoate cleavage protein [Paenarthrobacter sp. NPDC057355]|uniref:3-keto-5-aminohexanoate cleavage protein n=1 Tax=Paenarthrobacter sp. NPDC057355 TaxID=3346105 RepID=UPI00363BC862